MGIGYKKKAGHGRSTKSADEKRASDCVMLYKCDITNDGFSVDNGPLGAMFAAPKGDRAMQKFMLALLKDIGAYYNKHVANVSHSNEGLVESQSDLDKELEQLFKGVPIDSPLGDKINSLLGAAGEVGDSDTKDSIKFKKIENNLKGVKEYSDSEDGSDDDDKPLKKRKRSEGKTKKGDMASPLDNVLAESSEIAALEKMADNQERRQNLKERAEERTVEKEKFDVCEKQFAYCDKVIKQLESVSSRSEEQDERLKKAMNKRRELEDSFMGF